MSDPLWYKDTIIYELHVKAFFDANNDGIGDLQGLAQKLDYLCELGVGTLWLLPFYPSPLRDDGYDISDYRSINPTYGTMRDFRAFLNAAHERGLRVITELVVNHTSDQHPWFQRARRAKPDSAWRNFYVWSDTDQKYTDARIIFSDTEKSNWTWDQEAGAYYWHRFFSHQPDLNFDNPRLLKEMIRVMRYWLDMGVDGLRLDAIPYLIERDETSCENLSETHAVIKQLRAALDEKYSDRMLLAEANQWPEDVRPYFGEGDECHMAYHFPLMPRLYMAVAQEDRHPVTDIMRQTPEIPESCQWAIFLRNHDELTLEMVTDSERDYLWQFYANDVRARLNFGIRRRLAPLLENDRRKVELLYGLLMSMPGTPIIYYGDEIGMGDNVFLGDRDGVRTPMQWTPDRNAGFSRTDPAQLYLPPIMDPIYGYQARNVEAQSSDPSSLLNWLKRLIAVRQRHGLFGRGRIRFLYPGNRKVLAYLREDETQTVLCIFNLSRAPQPVELDLAEFKDRVPVELLGRSPFPPIGELPYFITLAGHGFYWFLLAQEAEAPSWHEASTPPLPELLTLVIPEGRESLAEGLAQHTLVERILPEFMRNQRWFGAKDARQIVVREMARTELADNHEVWAVLLYEVTTESGETQLYALPQGVRWGDRGDEAAEILLPWTFARVRHKARIGILYDATMDENFARAVIRNMKEDGRSQPGVGGYLTFSHGAGLSDILGADHIGSLGVSRLGREQSNTSLRIGEHMILKFYRQLQPGRHPEIEIGRHLTDVAKFANVPATLGAMEFISEDGTPIALAILQQFVANQGEGWQYAVDYLYRVLDEAEIRTESAGLVETSQSAFITLMHTLGQRTAEMHLAFSLPTDDPAFAPEPVSDRDVEAWRRRAHEQADHAFAALRQTLAKVEGDGADEMARLLTLTDAVHQRIDDLLPDRLDILKTRCHGDYHLGQVVLIHNDFCILDFEGEPTRSLDERRQKRLALLDVGGMLRSFDYAAWAALLRRGDIGFRLQDSVLEHAFQWQRETTAAFLDGYHQAIAGSPSYPEDRETAMRIINFFILEKACYELSYEATYRPDWLRIPVNGILRLIDDGAGGS